MATQNILGANTRLLYKIDHFFRDCVGAYSGKKNYLILHFEQPTEVPRCIEGIAGVTQTELTVCYGGCQFNHAFADGNNACHSNLK